jgi:hypothetical protein
MAGTFVSDTIQDGAGVSTSTTNVIQGCAKAWVKFSVSGTTPTINGSYNMSSVTRTAAGTYTFSMTNALANANYSVVTSQGLDTSNGTSIIPILFWNGADAVPTTSSFVVRFVAPSTGAAYDPKVCGLVVNN